MQKNLEMTEDSKRRRQLTRQKARTENDCDEPEEVEMLVEAEMLVEGESSPRRIIYKETVDILASPGLSPGPDWQAKPCFVYGSARYCAGQSSGHCHNRSPTTTLTNLSL